MTFRIFLISFLLFQCNEKKSTAKKLPVNQVIDTLANTIIKDSYRYIENYEDSTALAWYKEQTNHANKIVSKISNRNKITELQKQIDEKSNAIVSNLEITINNIYFYLKSSSQNSTKRLFCRKNFSGKEVLLFDPKQISEKKIINYVHPSWDGKKIVIGITENDLEIGQILVYDVVNRALLDDVIVNTWPSALGGVMWLPDNSGFTYEYIPVIDKKSENYLLNVETRLHLIGDKIKSDKVLLSKGNNPELKINKQDFPEVTFKNHKSQYMFASISGASYYSDYYYSDLKNLNKDAIDWKSLFLKEDLVKKFYIENNNIIFLSAKEAKNFQICKTDLLDPNFEFPEVLVEEDPSAVITDLALTSKGLFFVKTKNGVDANLFKLEKNKKITKVDIPEKAGYINIRSKGNDFDDLIIEIEGWISEKKQFKYNYHTNRFEMHQLDENSVREELLSNVIVEEIEVLSHDKVRVPMSIIYKHGMKLNGNNSVLMRGYGAFGISMEPYIDSYLLHWINNDGIYVVPHVRGGGEKGNLWHMGGFKKSKSNSWKDFIACAEHLINNNYTSKNKIAISSGSGGGVLVGNAITERPDLFGAAIATVAIFNTLRLEYGPNGKNLSREFGTLEDPQEVKYLLEMDAYNKIKNGGNYPGVFLTAGFNDSRVPVWQPAKFAARLQASTASNKPILFSVNFEGGHGFEASKRTKNKEVADLITFALWQTGHPDFQMEN